MSEFDSLFSYTHLRNHYLNSDMTSGILPVSQFLRAEHLPACRQAILDDAGIFRKRPNTLLQRELAPVSRQALWELHSGIMLRTLENISGIHNLLPDTHCRQSGIVDNPAELTGFLWHDQETGLGASMVLLVSLSTGDAVFANSQDAARSVAVDDPSLYITYWHHDSQCPAEQH